MAELQQTPGKVKFQGKLVAFDPSQERTYREGTNKKEKEYRTINLALKTSNNNVVYDIGLYGEVKDTVKLYGKVDGEKQKIEVPFDQRNNRPDGFTCYGFGTTRIGLDQDDKGKFEFHNHFNYDAAELLAAKLEDGMDIWINAEFNINTYVKDGETRTNVQYTATDIGGLRNPINFDDEEFKEVCSYEQEFVVVSHEYVKEQQKLYTIGRLINFGGSWKDMTFITDANKYKALAENIYKKTKFGDILSVQGVIRNGTELVEAEPEVELDWGGETPEGQGKVNRRKIAEIQITRVVTHKPKVYKESDFIVADDAFGASATNNDPFGEDPFA